MSAAHYLESGSIDPRVDSEEVARPGRWRLLRRDFLSVRGWTKVWGLGRGPKEEEERKREGRRARQRVRASQENNVVSGS